MVIATTAGTLVPEVVAPTGTVSVWPTVTDWAVMLLKTMRPPGAAPPIHPAIVSRSTFVLNACPCVYS